MTEETLFELALGTPEAERAVLLDRACEGKPELRARVEALLQAHENSGGFLNQASPQATADLPPARTSSFHSVAGESAGAVIAGKYTLVELIGEGGMGSVWRAKQSEPVKRFVAVKLIKAGMDSRQVLARFEAERQALALMDHPNIAKVLDGGLHDHRPFFVMELVKGIPITDYCDSRKLTPRERLELFVPVCQAIQHAHQKGIIHRDIKPSNVLIALYDDKPVVKVIDFGVAKATGGTLTEKTIDTGFGGVVGTPQYMSPEQATFNNADIDTRSDVYALGVLLYELLTGSPPFSKKELEQKGLLEMLRVVREEEPPRPSTKLSTADTLASLSANRSTEPRNLTGLLRQELDWIVMKALEKDRTRRYETANGFAADVLRYLSGEPVLAVPPSTAYRLKKFVRRNKGSVIAAGLVFFTLLAGIAGTSWGMMEANRARIAESERAEGERLAKLDADAKRQEAEKNLGYAKQGIEILGAVFSGLDTEKKYSDLGEFRQALAKNLKHAVSQLNNAQLGDPMVVASLQKKLGSSLLSLGEASHALEVYSKTLEIYEKHKGLDHPDTLMCMNEMAICNLRLGNVKNAIPMLKQVYEQLISKLGEGDHRSLVVMNNLAGAYCDDGKFEQALPLFEKSFNLRRERFGDNDDYTLTSMESLARVYFNLGRADRAVPLFEQTVKQMKVKLGTRHPHTLMAMNNLALAYHAMGDYKQGVPLLEETLQTSTAVLGEKHPTSIATLGNLANGYRLSGQLDRALPLFEKTLKLATEKYGENHPDTLIYMNNLATGYFAAKKLDEARDLFIKVCQWNKLHRGPDHPETLTSIFNLAETYRKAGNPQLAFPLYEEMAVGLEKRQFKHFRSMTIMRDMIDCYLKLKKYEQAETWQRKYLAAIKQEHGPNSIPYGQQLYVLT
ncbi:MAG: serine/threonine protein kinase, partial [Planctomycetia bacterium]|nr:serine/threonine protein kinase [Planctomycetia bacterium]